MKSIDPNIYNLHTRIKLKKTGKSIFIIIDRKTRIIMKDGRRILEIAEQIKQLDSEKKIGVLTNAPVCSKTKSFLYQNKITIEGL